MEETKRSRVLNKAPQKVDTSLLDSVDVEAAKKKASAIVLEERKKQVKADYLEQLLAEERAKFEPSYEMVDVLIDLPAYAENLLIDGRFFHHGEIVTVPHHVANSINEQMQRCWSNERLAGNPNLRDYKPVKMDSVSAYSAPGGKFGRV